MSKNIKMAEVDDMRELEDAPNSLRYPGRMRDWTLAFAIWLVACGGPEPRALISRSDPREPHADLERPPSSPGPLVIAARSIEELRQEAQRVREARRADVEADEDSAWVDDEANGFRPSGRRVFVYEDEAQTVPGLGTTCRAISARTDDERVTLIVDRERHGACVSTEEWQLNSDIFVSGGYRGPCTMALTGDGSLLRYSRVGADADHVVYASGAMGVGMECSSAVRDVACPAGGQAHCIVQEPTWTLSALDPDSLAGREAVAAPPEDECVVECAPNPCEEALGDDRYIGATYSRSSPTLAVFNRRPDCVAYARTRRELAARNAEADAADESAREAERECTDCPAPTSAGPTEYVRDLLRVGVFARSADSETRRWVSRQHSTLTVTQALVQHRGHGEVRERMVSDVQRCIEQLVNDQARDEEGGVRFAATYVVEGRTESEQYLLGAASAPQDVIGDRVLAERGRACFPREAGREADGAEATSLTLRFSTERE